jgi:LysR family transcriptional regulator, nitrogen assimilation regulatory protein
MPGLGPSGNDPIATYLGPSGAERLVRFVTSTRSIPETRISKDFVSHFNARYGEPYGLGLWRMQLRHLRYFVKIVEAGSFSRAAATIHVAQPALSQQIGELEEQLGLSLLQRSARGVRPTAAGEVLYREASSILRQMEQLPGIVRSSGGEPEGSVALGMSSTLAAPLAGSFIDYCKHALNKVTLKLAVADSETIKSRVDANTLDLAVVFEDELVARFARLPLFRQRLYLVRRAASAIKGASASLKQIATQPLILATAPNVTRTLLDRAFAANGLKPNVAAEADTLSSFLSALRAGIGDTILPKGDFSDVAGDTVTEPVLIEPPLYLTASMISSSDYPLTRAAEAVRGVLFQFVAKHASKTSAPGMEWIGGQEAIPASDSPISK